MWRIGDEKLPDVTTLIEKCQALKASDIFLDASGTSCLFDEAALRNKLHVGHACYLFMAHRRYSNIAVNAVTVD